MSVEKSIFVGKRHLFVKNNKGIFFFGGRDGTGKIILEEKKFISTLSCSNEQKSILTNVLEYLNITKIKTISCNNSERSTFLTHDGEVYILGKDDFQKINIKSTYGIRCSAIFSGEFVSFFQLDNGRVFGVGKVLTLGAHELITDENWTNLTIKEKSKFLNTKKSEPIELQPYEFLETSDLAKNAKIVDIKGGEKHTLLLTSSNTVYSCGFGTQLGHGRRNTYKINEKKRIPFKFLRISYFSKNKIDIIQINCGSNHSLFLTSSNDVYGCGNNDFGQLGLNHSKSTIFNGTPQKINANYLLHIKKIRCGINHSLFISKNGKFFACGDNRCNQFGISNGQSETKYLVPIELKFDAFFTKNRKFIDIFAGGYSNYFVTKNGNIYSCGDNRFGQCLQGSFIITKKTINRPRLIENIKIEVTPPVEEEAETKEEKEIKEIEKKKEEEIGKTEEQWKERISIGAKQVFIKTKNGRFVMIGNSKIKELEALSLQAKHKLNPTENEETEEENLMEIKLPNDFISSIVCHNTDHVLVLSKYGNVYAIGNNDYDKCGYFNEEIRKSKRQFSLAEVEIPFFMNKKVKSFYSGLNSSVFQLENGKFFISGLNRRTGLKDCVTIGINKEVNDELDRLQSAIMELSTNFLLKNEKICDFKSSGKVDLILTNFGNVYSRFFSLNHFEGAGHRIRTLLKIVPQQFFGNYNFLKIGFFRKNQIRIIQIDCGLKHSLFLSSTNEVYASGSNRFGQIVDLNTNLGVPQVISQLSDKKIVKIACGFNHSAFLSKDGRIFFSGKNKEHQIFPNLDVDSVHFPVLFQFVNPSTLESFHFADVYCGGNSSCCVTDTGRVIGLGELFKELEIEGNEGDIVRKQPKLLKNIEVDPIFDDEKELGVKILKNHQYFDVCVKVKFESLKRIKTKHYGKKESVKQFKEIEIIDSYF